MKSQKGTSGGESRPGVGAAIANEPRYAFGGLLVLLVVTAAVYWPGLSGPLLLDDLPQLNGLMEQSAQDPATLLGNYIISTSGPLGRPVSMATFVFDAVVHGSDTWWWKLSNVLLHLVSGILVYWLTALLVSALYKENTTARSLAGLVVAGIWLLHPLQVSTVLYLVQRMTELSTLFVFAGLVAYVKGRLLQEQSALKGWACIAHAFGVFFPLAAFSKESGLLFPVYCTLIEFTVFRFRGDTIVRKSLLVAHGVLLFGYAAATILILAGFSEIVLSGYVHRDFTLGERVLTQFRVVTLYLSQLLLPVQSRMGFFHDDIVLSTSLLQPISTLFSALFLAVVFGSAIYAWRRLPLYSFGILFFFASHALESTVFGLELMFEHRNYVGSFGIFLAFWALAVEAVANKKALRVAAVVGICCLAVLTWQRSVTWGKPENLYQYAYRVHPESARLNTFFANAYASIGEFDTSRKYLSKLARTAGSELHGLLVDCHEYGKVSETDLSRIARLDIAVVESYVTSTVESIVEEMKAGRCSVPYNSLIDILDSLLLAHPRSPNDQLSVRFSRASVLEMMDDLDGATAAYFESQELFQESALPMYLAADMLARNGRPGEARKTLLKAAEVEQQSRVVRKDLAETIYQGIADFYLALGQPDAALATYREAMESIPNRDGLCGSAGRLISAQQRIDEIATAISRDCSDYSLLSRVR